MAAVHSGSEAIAALRALPCGARLLDAFRNAGPAWIVGGAVRDVLRGHMPRELDVVVEGDPAPLASMLGEVVRVHERFGTYDVVGGDCVYDLVRARAPIDAFGVGTRMGVSADQPYLDTAYKMVDYAGRPVMKLSSGKVTAPGRKQVFRRRKPFGDLIGLFEEQVRRRSGAAGRSGRGPPAPGPHEPWAAG